MAAKRAARKPPHDTPELEIHPFATLIPVMADDDLDREVAL
jgi:hypothetical protein